MCGFLGIYSNKRVDLELAECSLLSLQHRGPDNQSSWNNGANIYLGHCRLSIIDLTEKAMQPLFDRNGEVGIVFNGEIYNYDELKTKLAKSVWTSLSDTEVILEGYKKWGIIFFEQLRGIYSFAIYDNRKNEKVILMRDPSGVKPLYYHASNEFIFASEIKALKNIMGNRLSPDDALIKSFLHLGFCTEPFTSFNEVIALEPGICLEYDGSKISLTEINKYSFDLITNSNHETDQNISHLLSQAIERNMVSDVPVMFALSGGIDSSLIAGLASTSTSNIKTVTVAFNDKEYDESELAIKYSKYLNIENLLIDSELDFDLDELNILLDHFDQPFADSSFIPSYFLNKAASQHTKVLIGGDGGDELFNGYPSMSFMRLAFKYNSILNPLLSLFDQFSFNQSWVRKLSKLSKIIGYGGVPEALYLRASWFPAYTRFNGKNVFNFGVDEPINYLKQAHWPDGIENPESFISKFYFSIIMRSDYLRKSDLMSMMNSVEYRVPFLDEDLVSFALSIPFKHKSSLTRTKKPLRRLHAKFYNKLGSNVSKSGFSIPLDNYLNRETKNEIKSIIFASDIFHWVDVNYVNFLFGQLNNFNAPGVISRASVYQRILILYSLVRWLNVNRF